MFYRKTVITVLMGVIIIPLILTGCSLGEGNGGLAAPEMDKIPEIRYITREVVRQDIKREVREVTRIQPANPTLVFTRFGGWLKANYGETNKFVEKGELLVEFDGDSLELKYKEHEVSLEKLKGAAKNSLEQIKRDLSLGLLDLEKLNEKLLDLVDKKERVAAAGLISDLASIEDQIERAKREILAKELAIETIEDRYEVTKTTYEIEIQSTQDKLEDVAMQLAETRIYAPKDGLLLNVSRLREGEYINPYQSLMVLVAIEDIQLVYSGLNASKFEVGMKVTFILDKEELPGEVISSPAYYSPDASANLKESVIFKINGLDVETFLNLKTDIRVNLVLEEKKDTIAIPRSYLKNHLGNRYVYVLEDGMKKMRYVETGIEGNIDIEIIKGLEEGDLLVD